MDDQDRWARERRIWEDIPFNRRCGFRVVRWDDEAVAMEAPYADDHTNGLGAMHGGLLGVLIDTTACGAVLAGHRFGRGRGPTTISMTVNYLAGVRSAVVAEARCRERAPSAHFVAVAVTDADGTLVAEGLVTVAV